MKRRDKAMDDVKEAIKNEVDRIYDPRVLDIIYKTIRNLKDG